MEVSEARCRDRGRTGTWRVLEFVRPCAAQGHFAQILRLGHHRDFSVRWIDVRSGRGNGAKASDCRATESGGHTFCAQPARTFTVKLAPGLYRLQPISAVLPAVLQISVDGVAIGLASPTQPFATVMRIVNDRLQGTTDLPPTGLCSSDVSTDGVCAGQKFHFRLTHKGAVSIKVTARPKGAGPIQGTA